jgi:hypothetical protein
LRAEEEKKRKEKITQRRERALRFAESFYSAPRFCCGSR